jgi:hypothetical protein
MSIVLKRQQLKKPLFSDFNGEVKSGRLGGDFLLWHSVSQTQHLILAQKGLILLFHMMK